MGYFHISILVADLDEAIPRFARLFGVEFNPPSVLRSPIEWHGRKLEMDVRVTYSKTEPYIELIQGQDGGYFDIAQGEGVHHVGVWAPERGSAAWRERFGDLEVEALLPSPSGAVIVQSEPRCLCGVRVEILDERGRSSFEQWVAGGVSERSVRS